MKYKTATKAQKKAYNHLISSGYEDELEWRGVNKASELTEEVVTAMINEYTNVKATSEMPRGYLYDKKANPENHYDHGFDMGYALGILSL